MIVKDKIFIKWPAWLSTVVLLVSFSLYHHERGPSLDRLTEIREWALKQRLWSNLADEDGVPLIAVRHIYNVEQNQLRLNAYLLVPCRAVCGVGSSCARQCQSLIQNWRGHSTQARLMIEGYDLKKDQSLGRLILDEIAPIKLRYWSRKHKLISLIQDVSSHERTLHVIKLKASHGSEHTPYLSYYDRLSLGSYHGFESPLEGSVTFRDLNGDGQIELLAPLESLVHLRPISVFVPTPYKLTDKGLQIAPELIALESPKQNELRQWLLSLRGNDEQSITMSKVKRVLSFGLLLCLKDQCKRGDELIGYAYPQHTAVIQLWGQLRRYTNRPHHAYSNQEKSDNPYSALDL
jgi:hypothetical protein